MPIEIPELNTQFVLTLLEAAAVIVSAMAGMLVAAQKRMDIVGAYALACVNAFGGGTVRDLLLDNRPFYWMLHWGFLLAIMLICVPFVYSARMYRLASDVQKRSVKIDAIGLALFTVAGVGIALEKGTPLLVAALMGVITGTMGGVLRDLMVNELPDLFRPGGLYASASFTGGLAFIAGIVNDVDYSQCVAIGIGTTLALRLLSLRTGMTVPTPHWAEKPDAPET